MTTVTEEVWKDITGYEQLYQVSNLGHLRSYPKPTFHGIHDIRPRVGADGYYKVNLYKDGYNRTFRLHRLVAQEFIKNPLNLHIVRIINGNRLDCSVTNLRWSSASNNNISSASHVINQKKAVRQFDLEGKLINTYESLTQACYALEVPTSRKCGIVKAIKRNSTAYGYVWKWVE